MHQSGDGKFRPLIVGRAAAPGIIHVDTYVWRHDGWPRLSRAGATSSDDWSDACGVILVHSTHTVLGAMHPPGT